MKRKKKIAITRIDFLFHWSIRTK